MRRVLAISVVAAVLLLAVSVGGAAVETASASATGSAAIHADAPTSATPAECDAGDGPELVGCWNGTHYEDALAFDQADGLTQAELAVLTDLTMARVEHIRERPFRRDVPVETVTRSDFMNDSADGGFGGSPPEYQRWNDQVWKALFVVGEAESTSDAIGGVYGSAVSGFYSPAQDRIVLVVPAGEDPQIAPSTLAHELIHAMQDQYHDLSRPRYAGATQDGDLAINGIVEGEAVHVEERYAARCADNWTCPDPPASGGGGGSGADYNFGILQTILQPYGDGALYVRELVAADGWRAVNETMNDPPESTAEVIHRDPDYETREVAFEDTATGGWETYPDQGVEGADTAGEASMFVMFWYQSYAYDYPVFDPAASAQENVQIHTQTDERLETRFTYNYEHPVTVGWADDELYPYRNGDRDGYVWATEWQTTADATEFRDAYLRMLTAHGGDEFTAGEVYEIPDGDFRGAYGVERTGTRVTVTHAPAPDGVLDLRPNAGLAVPTTTGADAAGSDADNANGTDTDAPDTESAGDSGTADGAPGFGVTVALVALLAAVALGARRVRP